MRVIGRIGRIVCWTVMCLVLLVYGLVAGVYNPGIQRSVVQAALDKVNRGSDTRLSVGKLRLTFPLGLDIQDFLWTHNATGDTLAAAASVQTALEVKPLFKGVISAPLLALQKGLYGIGGPDSTLYMRIRLGDGRLHGTRVSLGDTMLIQLGRGALSHGRVSMAIRPDSTPTDTVTPPTRLIIRAGELDLRDFGYQMNLEPSIDSLSALMGQAKVEGVDVDLLAHRIDVKRFTGQRLNAAYIAPFESVPTPTEPEPVDTTSEPWQVRVHRIAFTHSQGLYALRGVKPAEGLDFSYIQAKDMILEVDEFYNCAAVVRVPITRLAATERCGVTLDGSLTLDIGDEALRLNDIHLTTDNYTELKGRYLMGMGGDLTADPNVALGAALTGQIDPKDVQLMFPSLDFIVKALPSSAPLQLTADVDGTAGRLQVKDFALIAPRCVRLKAKGTVTDVFGADGPGLDLALDGHTDAGIAMLKEAFLGADPDFAVPVLSVKGTVKMMGQDYAANINMNTLGGEMRLRGDFRRHAEAYQADLALKDFPVNAFMPYLGVGRVTAAVKAKGQGFDFTSPKAYCDASVQLDKAHYKDYNFSNITLDAKLHDGKADVALHTCDPSLTSDINLLAQITPQRWDLRLGLDVPNANLHAMGLTAEPLSVGTNLDLNAAFMPGTGEMSLRGNLRYLDLTDAVTTTEIEDVDFHFTSDSITQLSLNNYDLHLTAVARCPVAELMTVAGDVGQLLSQQIEARRLDVEAIQRALPELSIDMTSGSGSDNFLARMMHRQSVSFQGLDFSCVNDSALSLMMRAQGLVSGATQFDTVAFDIRQRHDTLALAGRVANPPGVNDEFARVGLMGYLAPSETWLHLQQQNIKGKTGYELGARVQYADSAITLSFTPQQAMIAYKPWQLNPDNYISYTFATKHICADLSAQGAGSAIRLFTPEDTADQDVQLQLTDIHLQDWLAVNPFAPPITGDVSADMNVRWGGGGLWGEGKVTLDSLYYGKDRVGDITADLDVTTLKTGLMKADVALWIDGHKTATLTGALNDSTRATPFNLDFKMFHFPLATVNPFLPKGTARLTGWLNGSMDVSGSKENSILDGTLTFDSATVKIDMLGATYPISSSPINVQNSRITLQDFGITALNGNPLALNGWVDIMDLARPRLDVTLKGQNLQIVNSKRASKYADVYGKAYIDLDASATGDLGTFLKVQADLALLSQTNVTYVIPDAVSAITQHQTQEMVKFVNFSDTAMVEKADSVFDSSMVLGMDALVTLQPGAVINVDLSADGKNKVSVQPEGTLNFTMAPLSDGRLTGRINIDQGFVRYTPPLMSEKLFNFDEGSYVAFNGPILNPVLNIHATDLVKANVTEAGQNSRLIDFDVMLGVTGTLNNMDVKFDLATDDDMTVANELSSMSADQRANQAMALLLYNTYTGGGAHGDANLAGNPLYTFLSSQLNTWAANNIKGVDLTFGIDQYSNTRDGTTKDATQYSYQLSKTLFNDKFKIVIGGNYSTDANSDENFRQNLINDISFEYYLNRARSIYLTLFRHTGYESILEGEVTQTGVGFVYRRKINSLRSLWPFHRHKDDKKPAADKPVATEPADSLTHTTPQ